ncbi:Hypothetical protein Ccan_03890 [Capnocytophaga canimorsus Cc5]|uniref:Uncharacterized protein n=1 Tax=Capnocytophaga canimorsus (strain 5) TaxID=860228 RepID=F9YRN2_CAPCC|nr:Hypothetical protein Ccan_03890 [Capnocytophaga canimorsus Cc5]
MSLSFIKKLKKLKSYSPKNKTNLVRANCYRLFLQNTPIFQQVRKIRLYLA